MATDPFILAGKPITPTSEIPLFTGSLVSIIIPCCGMLEYTRLCVPSVLKHSRQPFELIFLDIGSLDGGVPGFVHSSLRDADVCAWAGEERGTGESMTPFAGTARR